MTNDILLSSAKSKWKNIIFGLKGSKAKYKILISGKTKILIHWKKKDILFVRSGSSSSVKFSNQKVFFKGRNCLISETKL